VELVGLDGAVLRGALVIDRGCPSGSIANLRIEDAGDCCLRIKGGAWTLSNLRLRCSHGAALELSNDAHAELNACTLGGEGRSEPYHPGVQASSTGERYGCEGSFIHAVHALVARDGASTALSMNREGYNLKSAIFGFTSAWCMCACA